MREIIPPSRLRAQVQSDEAFLKALQAHNEAKEAKRDNAARLLEEAWADLPEETRRTIRMHVALRVPSKPMDAHELQVWLDEHTLGVVRYMMTGKVT